ncbi:MAG: hypothetical protein JO267_15070 [Alphaproteobacteria bacterium]|nr:hypothetical protein [Alphaproteobacteria bacterium]MBV9863458.1 hypothetical protein [Alphaproteobacteria bacterium]
MEILLKWIAVQLAGETARELECDEDKERFKKKLKRVAKAKLSPDKSRPSGPKPT